MNRLKRKTIAIFAWFLAGCSTSPLPSPQVRDLTAEQIKAAVEQLQPGLPQGRSEVVAQAIAANLKTGECGVPWPILVSIAYHESRFGLHPYNAVSKDYGLMQINNKQVLRLGLVHAKVMTDATYSVRAACKILGANKARYGKKLTYWLGIYRSGTALWRDEIRDNAIRYDTLIRGTARSLQVAALR